MLVERGCGLASDGLRDGHGLAATSTFCGSGCGHTCLLYAVPRFFDRCLQLFVRGLPFAKLHGGLVIGERHLRVGDTRDGLQRGLNGANAAAAGHSGNFQGFSLHGDDLSLVGE